MTTSSRFWRDVAVTALAPAIWGSTYIVTTELLPPERPFTAALLRVLPAGLLLLAWSRRRPQAGEWWRLWLLSALNIGVFQALLFVAAYRLPGGIAAVVGACQPLLVMALLWLLEQQAPRRLALLAAGGGMAGMALLLLSPAAHWDALGVLAALGGAACMACGTYLTRRWGSSLPVLALTGWQLLLGGVLLAPLAWQLDPPLPLLAPRQWLGYGYLSLAGALLAYALWFRGVARLPAVAVSSLGLLSPLCAVLLGWLLLGQSLRGWALGGLLLVLGSVLAVQWSSQQPVPRRG
ncbi:EamA family transporter [Vogesella oryzae]|uniref:EamA family transporter n=1 Tax=Vogesella oryzae TaxID=1735285 RepID=UPI0015826E5B|nr:EamA family transporter [Vogesella oryzae]